MKIGRLDAICIYIYITIYCLIFDWSGFWTVICCMEFQNDNYAFLENLSRVIDKKKEIRKFTQIGRTENKFKFIC